MQKLLKVRLHTAIYRARFVFWRVKNTGDVRHHSSSLNSSGNLKCDLFTRAHSIAYARMQIAPDKSMDKCKRTLRWLPTVIVQIKT